MNKYINFNEPEYYTNVQVADIDGDGKKELITIDKNGINVWKYNNKEANLQQISNQSIEFLGGDYWNEEKYYKTIKIGDIDNDKKAEMISRSFYGIQTYKYISNKWEKICDGPLWSDNAGWFKESCYDTIRLVDIDGDNSCELVGKSPTEIEVYKYNIKKHEWNKLSNIPLWTTEERFGDRCYFRTINFADIDGDNAKEFIARSTLSMEVYKYNKDSDKWLKLEKGPLWSDANYWSYPYYYETICVGDIDGDDAQELIGRWKNGIQVYKYNPSSNLWIKLSSGGFWTDNENWKYHYYYRTICVGDIDGDEVDELIGRGPMGIEIYKYNTIIQQWMKISNGQLWSDKEGYKSPTYYKTIQLADVDNDNIMEIIGRENNSLVIYKYNVLKKTWKKISTIIVTCA